MNSLVNGVPTTTINASCSSAFSGSYSGGYWPTPRRFFSSMPSITFASLVVKSIITSHSAPIFPFTFLPSLDAITSDLIQMSYGTSQHDILTVAFGHSYYTL